MPSSADSTASTTASTSVTRVAAMTTSTLSTSPLSASAGGRVGEDGGAGGRSQVDRVAGPGGVGRGGGEPGPRRLRQPGDVDGAPLGGVRSEDAEAAGVADHTEPSSRGQRLLGEQRRGVDEVDDVVDGHHPGGAVERLQGAGGRGVGGGVEAPARTPAAELPAEDDEQRLAPG